MCEGSLFIELIGVDTTAESITMHKAEASTRRASIPAQVGQIAIVFSGLSSLYDVNGINTLNIRASMPLGQPHTAVPSSPRHGYALDAHLPEGETVVTSEIFFFWKAEKEIICRYVTDGAGDEVVLQSKLCVRAELRHQARYLLLPAKLVPNATNGGKKSSLNALTNGDFIGLLRG